MKGVKETTNYDSSYYYYNNNNTYVSIFSIPYIPTNGNICGNGRNSYRNLYLTFSRSYSLSFFIDQMKNHYTNLNDNVFLHLHNLELQFQETNLQTLLDECYVNIPTTPLYSQAMDHLKKDNKIFFTEKDELMGRINKYNKYIQKTDAKVKAIIDEKISKGGLGHYLHPTMGYQKYVYGMYSVIKKHIISRIHDDRDLLILITDTNLDIIGGEIIADSLNLDKAHSILNDVKNDYSLFAYLKELQIMRKDIDSKLEDIRNLMSEIINSISIGDYHTKRKCCPTFWKLVEDYIF